MCSGVNQDHGRGRARAKSRSLSGLPPASCAARNRLGLASATIQSCRRCRSTPRYLHPPARQVGDDREVLPSPGAPDLARPAPSSPALASNAAAPLTRTPTSPVRPHPAHQRTTPSPSGLQRLRRRVPPVNFKLPLSLLPVYPAHPRLLVGNGPIHLAVNRPILLGAVYFSTKASTLSDPSGQWAALAQACCDRA